MAVKVWGGGGGLYRIVVVSSEALFRAFQTSRFEL